MKGAIENGVMVWRDERGEVCEPPASRMVWTQGEIVGGAQTDRDALYRGVYDVGLGVVLEGRAHRERLMRENGLECVG